MNPEDIIENNFACDIVWPIRPQYDNTYESLDRFKAAGFDLVSVTLAGDQHNAYEALQMVASHRQQVLTDSNRFILVESAADIERAQKEKKLAIIFHFEGTRPFERNIDLVEAFYRLGIRFNLLAFNQNNSAGGGAMEPEDPGLTAFGRRIVEEMERVGMLLDLSHTGRRTTMDAMNASTRPVIFSHHGADAIFRHPRNLTDEQMKTCAETGGVCGVTGSSMYIGDDNCRTESVFKHIDYMAELIGPQHIGIGFDVIFNAEPLNDWIRARPDEWPIATDPEWTGVKTVVPEQLVELVGIMQAHGYTNNDIVGIIGGNFHRIFTEFWG